MQVKIAALLANPHHTTIHPLFIGVMVVVDGSGAKGVGEGRKKGTNTNRRTTSERHSTMTEDELLQAVAQAEEQLAVALQALRRYRLSHGA